MHSTPLTAMTQSSSLGIFRCNLLNPEIKDSLDDTGIKELQAYFNFLKMKCKEGYCRSFRIRRLDLYVNWIQLIHELL